MKLFPFNSAMQIFSLLLLEAFVLVVIAVTFLFAPYRNLALLYFNCLITISEITSLLNCPVTRAAFLEEASIP